MAEAEATPAPVIYVVFANPKNTKSAFQGTFNQIAAKLCGGKYCHVGIAFKVNEHATVGYHTSIVWGGSVFCDPVPFNPVTATDGKITLTVPQYGIMDAVRVDTPIDFEVSNLIKEASRLVSWTYDEAGAVRSVGPALFSRVRKSDDERIFCSELVAHLLHKCVGVKLPDTNNTASLNPNDIYKWVSSLN